MKIVIDIPDDEIPKKQEYMGIGLHFIDGTVCKCTYPFSVLPKGHGDLIDRNKLEKDTEWDEYEDGFISYSHSQIFNEPVVIPADK